MAQFEWDGQRLSGDRIALAVVCVSKLGHDAEPVLAAARAAEARCLLRPDRLGEFVRVHRDVTLICHDVGATHWAIADHLERGGDLQALEDLWRCSHEGKLADVGLLDQLVALAVHGVETPYRALAALARDLLSDTLQSDRELRDLAATCEGQSWEAISGTAKQTVLDISDAVFEEYNTLIDQANRIVTDQKVDEGLIDWFGPLSLTIQVQGAIAVSRASRLGLRFRKDARDAIGRIIARCEAEYKNSSHALWRNESARACFGWDGDGLVAVDDEGRPRVNKSKLRAWLPAVLADEPGVNDIPIEPPLVGTEQVATTTFAWADVVDSHRLLQAWTQLESAAHVKRSLLAHAEHGELRCRYETLPRLHSKNPSMESLHLFSDSALFEPPPRSRMVVVELPDLELRCLAATCQAYGCGSVLAERFEAGEDPTRLAAERLYQATNRRAVVGPDLERLREDDPVRYQGFIDIARAILRVAPRGLAPRHVRNVVPLYVERDALSIDFEMAYRAVVRELFTELRILVTHSVSRILAHKLECDLYEMMFFDQHKGPPSPRSVDVPIVSNGLTRRMSRRDTAADSQRRRPKKVVEPRRDRRFGGAAIFPDRTMWGAITGKLSRPDLLSELHAVCQNPALRERLAQGRGGPDLYKLLLTLDTITGLGRIRGALAWNRGGSLDYLDLADDVRKRVAYAIVGAGHELVAVAGDEFVVLIRDRPTLGAVENALEQLRASVDLVANELLERLTISVRVSLREAW